MNTGHSTDRNFTISHMCRVVAGIQAATAHAALQAWASGQGMTIVGGLRTERPTRVFTHNGENDYLAEQWSGEVADGRGKQYRVYVRS